MRWVLKPLLALSVAAATAGACDLGYNGPWSGRDPLFLRFLQGPSPELTGAVRYEDRRGRPSPFEELAGGALGLRGEEQFTYVGALFVPDLDGDGAADLALSAGNVSSCGNDVSGALELYSGDDLAPIGGFSGYAQMVLQLGSTGELLEVRTHGWKPDEVRVRANPTAEPLWMLRSGDMVASSARLVGDLDGDGHDEVALGDAWSRDEQGARYGRVQLLRGSDGRALWEVGRSAGEDERFGRAVAPAGDWNGDGVPDVAALAERSVSILSGVDGARLERGQVSGRGELRGLDALGDLDGDGRMDFRLTLDAGPWVQEIVSSSDWRPLDVAGGWTVVWSAPGAVPPCRGGDLDGDGLDDLVVGRLNRETGERRLSLASAAGLVDVRTLGEDEPSWEPADQSWYAFPGAAVGRIHQGAPWTVLLTLVEEQGWRTYGRAVLLPGT